MPDAQFPILRLTSAPVASSEVEMLGTSRSSTALTVNSVQVPNALRNVSFGGYSLSFKVRKVAQKLIMQLIL